MNIERLKSLASPSPNPVGTDQSEESRQRKESKEGQVNLKDREAVRTGQTTIPKHI